MTPGAKSKGMAHQRHRIGGTAAWLCALSLLGFAPAVPAQTPAPHPPVAIPTVGDGPDVIGDAARLLDRQESELLALYHRLAVAAAPWCEARPLPGILLRDIRQYAVEHRTRLRFAFGLGYRTMVYVAAVVPGSPAERAGVQAHNTVIAVGDTPLNDEAGGQSRRWLDMAEERLWQVGEDGTFDVTTPAVASTTRRHSWVGDIGCPADIQVVTGGTRWARAGGGRIQVPQLLFSDAESALLPAHVAHELAHLMLEHEQQTAERGRVTSAQRRALAYEQEFAADRWALWILQRAQLDPQLMVDLLRREGELSRHPNRRLPRHPAWAERVRRAETALAAMRVRLAQDPSASPRLADAPLPEAPPRPM